MSDRLIKSIPTDLYIGGEWRRPSDGERFDVRDPATGEVDDLSFLVAADVRDRDALVRLVAAAIERAAYARHADL